MLDKRQMRTWMEVDLDALAHNYTTLRAMLPEGCKLLGLVKANAYGHGAVPVARKLEQLGCEMLAVACVSEAEELRTAGISLPILCLGKTPVEQVEALLANQVTQTVEDLETGKALSKAAEAAGRKLKIHVKLDSGMGRLGFIWDKDRDNSALLDEITELCALPGLEAEGFFTHFSDADGSEDYTMDQLTRYLDAKKALCDRGVTFAIYHCGASAAVLHYPCTHMDMARPGIALYGYYPDPELEGMDGPGLKPVMTVKSRIAAVRNLQAGASVSYGRTATLKRDSKLAVVPIGYGDGYPRALSNRMDMNINGRRCPVVGRICMDMCMVDVTDLPEVNVGDVAVVYDGELLQHAADLTDTIVYELLCDVTARVPRIYLEQGEVLNEQAVRCIG